MVAHGCVHNVCCDDVLLLQARLMVCSILCRTKRMYTYLLDLRSVMCSLLVSTQRHPGVQRTGTEPPSVRSSHICDMKVMHWHDAPAQVMFDGA